MVESDLGIQALDAPIWRSHCTMRIAWLTTLLPLLAGCASAPVYTWYNPNVPVSAADTQGRTDIAECQAYAIQTIPLPAPPASSEPNPPRRYQVSGTVNAQPYRATVTEKPRIVSVSEIAAQNEANRQYRTTVEAQRNLAEACMMRRGSQKVAAAPVSREAIVLPAQNAVDDPAPAPPTN